MSKILVYHIKDGVAPSGRGLLFSIGDGEVPIDFENNHDLVAEVEVHSEGLRALDEAYKLTQNINRSWTNNQFVEVKGQQTRFRSTHTGDVLVMGKKPYVCVSVGWKAVLSPEQKIFQRPSAQEGIVIRPPNNYGKR